MRDIENRKRAPRNQVFKPLQRRNIQIVCGFIQKQDIRFFHQQFGKLHLYFFTAGKSAKLLFRKKKLDGQSELIQNVCMHIILGVRKVFRERKGIAACVHGLGQISEFRFGDHIARTIAIVRYEPFLINKL